MDDYSGEKLLDKIYKDLYNSESVLHTKKNGDNREESIRRYMDRLERVHRKANTEHKKNLIKRIYYDKYVIKKDNIDIYHNNPDVIISAQQKGISRWIDYLTDENARYPMWTKYWAFQGMLRMGTYDELRGMYTKRSAKTIAPFLEVNPELIAKCINNIIKVVNKDKLSEEELNSLIEIESFQKLYTLYEKQYKERRKSSLESNEGKWVKYNEGSRQDAIKLAKSLEGMNTGWCTASEDMATYQLCGDNFNSGGDFYVYYTKQDGEYVVPRIAIRLDGHDRIGEIRGIESDQNLEEVMIKPLEDKLNEMDFLNKGDIEENLIIIQELRSLHNIGNKTKNNIPLTEAEIMDLYTKKYGFGWANDPSVEKIIKKRNCSEDYKMLTDTYSKRIILRDQANYMNDVEDDDKLLLELASEGYNVLNAASKRLKNNKEFVLKMNDYTPFGLLESVSDELKDDEEIVLKAVSNNGIDIQYASERLQNDRKVILEAIKNCGWAITCIDERFRKDEEIGLAVAKSDASSVRYLDSTLLNNKTFISKAMKLNPLCLEYASILTKYNRFTVLALVSKDGKALQFAAEKLRDNKGIVLRAVSNDGISLQFASERLQNDKEVVLTAIANNPYALGYVSDNLKDDKEIALSVVSKDGLLLAECSERICNDKEVALAAIANNPYAFSYVSDNLKDDKEIALSVVSKDGVMLREFSDKIRNDKEVALAAVNNSPYALTYVSDNLKDDKEIAFSVVSKNGYKLQEFSDKIRNDKEVVLAAVNNNPYALDYVNDNLKDDKEIALSVVSKVGIMLQDFSERIRNDKEVALAAVNNNPYALDYVSDNLKDDKEIALSVVSKAGLMLQEFSERIRNDKEVALAAIANESYAFNYVSDNLKNDKDILSLIDEAHDRFIFVDYDSFSRIPDPEPPEISSDTVDDMFDISDPIPYPELPDFVELPEPPLYTLDDMFDVPEENIDNKTK